MSRSLGDFRREVAPEPAPVLTMAELVAAMARLSLLPDRAEPLYFTPPSSAALRGWYLEQRFAAGINPPSWQDLIRITGV